MAPLQRHAVPLIVIGASLAAARFIAEYLGGRNPSLARHLLRLRVMVPASRLFTLVLPAWGTALLRAAVVTTMLSGLLSSWWDVVSLALPVGVIVFAREVFLPRLAQWIRLMGRVPLILRLVIAALISYQSGSWIVGALWGRTETFRPLSISVVVSLIVFSLLLPKAQRQGEAAMAGGQP